MTNRRLAFWVSIFLFAIYLATFSGKFHVMDELAVFTVGHNLAQRGAADLNPLIWTNDWTPNPPGIWGADSNLYTKKAPGISLMSAPLIWLGHHLPDLNAVYLGLLTNIIISACTAGCLFLWLRDLDFGRGVALLTTLGYGLGTVAWIYARMFWESTVLALLFLGGVWLAWRLGKIEAGHKRWRGLGLLGGLLGFGLFLRFETAPLIGFIGLYLGYTWLGQAKQPLNPSGVWLGLKNYWQDIVAYLAPVSLAAGGLLYFNFIRFGNPLETGYSQEVAFGWPWRGAFGLLFSPGIGLFIYAPVTLLLFGGVFLVWQRLPKAYLNLVGGICLFYWLFYGAWFSWGGTWGWGPRFLLPILPLLMLFVAPAVAWLGQPGRERLAQVSFLSLGGASLIINLLGLVIDFNDHFVLLDSNDNFVFNWAAFPPLAHWRLLREGASIDLIWLTRGAEGWQFALHLLAAPLIIGVMAALNLGASYRGERQLLPSGVGLALTIFLTMQMMWGAAHLSQGTIQAQADGTFLTTLQAEAKKSDTLLVTMPPFGDVQEFSTWLMGYQHTPIPAYIWIDDGPRAIGPTAREAVMSNMMQTGERVWLFERWLTPSDPLRPTANRMGQEAFLINEAWLPESGRLSLYALPQTEAQAVALNVSFGGGLTLLDFALGQEELRPGDVLRLRLTWQAAAVEAGVALPSGPTIAFAQLLPEVEPGRVVAQQDRLLLNLQGVSQSPLLPGQTVTQGYGLNLPTDLSPGPYLLIVGLYNAETLQRLPRNNNPDDFLYLTTLTISLQR